MLSTGRASLRRSRNRSAGSVRCPSRLGCPQSVDTARSGENIISGRASLRSRWVWLLASVVGAAQVLLAVEAHEARRGRAGLDYRRPAVPSASCRHSRSPSCTPRTCADGNGRRRSAQAWSLFCRRRRGALPAHRAHAGAREDAGGERFARARCGSRDAGITGAHPKLAPSAWVARSPEGRHGRPRSYLHDHLVGAVGQTQPVGDLGKRPIVRSGRALRLAISAQAP